MRLTSLALFAFWTCAAGFVSGGSAQTADATGTWTAEIRTDRVFLQLRTDANDPRTEHRFSSLSRSVPPSGLTGFPAGGTSLSARNIRFELRREAGTFVFDGDFQRGQGAGLFTFTPRSEFAGELRALGYSNVDLPIWRQLRLAFNDVGPRYIRALSSEGLGILPLDEIERGINHGVSFEYIRGLTSHGYRGLPWDQLIRARDHGVTASFIEELRDEGFGNLTFEQLVRTKDHGVGGDFTADMRAVKIDSAAIDDFIRLRDHGVTPGFVNHIRARGYNESTVEEVIRLRDRGLR